MATHFSYDHELLGEAIAEVRTHWKGMFALGIDHTVVNVTKDAIWIREAALPDTANNARPDPQWMIKEIFGGHVPKEITFPPAKVKVADNQEQAVRDLEIKAEEFTPEDQRRQWVREFPSGLTISPAALMGPPPKRS
jgi:ribonuclease Z